VVNAMRNNGTANILRIFISILLFQVFWIWFACGWHSFTPVTMHQS